MPTGAITEYVDVAQIVLYAFWIFFAGLIYYLLQENKREGYPLENDRSAHITVQGWPPIPAPKTFFLRDGGSVVVPREDKSPQVLNAEPNGNYPGAPLEPFLGENPLLAGVGPGAWSDRADVPDLTYEGYPLIVPLRAAPKYGIAVQDVDPRGLNVVGADGEIGGVVTDVWVDQSDIIFRYLEVEVPDGRRVLVPFTMTRIGRKAVRVRSILGHQFANVPRTRLPDQVTRLEEEKIMAYYGAGTLYATPSRQEPLL